jgi:uncharacterized protein (TIGR02596 family)
MITHHPFKKNLARRGFTLVELLMVMAIMLVIMGLVIVAFPSLGKAGNLTNGTQSFVDLLNQARQSALSQNRNVEVRFYYLPGPTDGTTCTGYRAMRVIVCDSSGLTMDPVNTTAFAIGAKPGLVQKLPVGVVIYADTTGKFTTLLPSMSNSTTPIATWPASISTTLKPTTGTEVFPGSATPVSYAAFQFRPTGGTNLDPLGTLGSNSSTSDKWFMSFKTQVDAVQGTTKPAINFITVVVDPITGRVRSYRPS